MTSILHRHAYLVIFIDGFADVKRGIAQSITKGEQCVALEVAVGTILHRVVEEVRQVVGTLIERDG